MWKLRIGHFSKFPQISSRRGPQHLVLDTLLTGGEGFSMLGGGLRRLQGWARGWGQDRTADTLGLVPPTTSCVPLRQALAVCDPR